MFHLRRKDTRVSTASVGGTITRVRTFPRLTHCVRIDRIPTFFLYFKSEFYIFLQMWKHCTKICQCIFWTFFCWWAHRGNPMTDSQALTPARDYMTYQRLIAYTLVYRKRHPEIDQSFKLCLPKVYLDMLQSHYIEYSVSVLGDCLGNRESVLTRWTPKSGHEKTTAG